MIEFPREFLGEFRNSLLPLGLFSEKLSSMILFGTARNRPEEKQHDIF